MPTLLLKVGCYSVREKEVKVIKLICTTRALRADQSEVEAFANIIEVSEAYTGIYEKL